MKKLLIVDCPDDVMRNGISITEYFRSNSIGWEYDMKFQEITPPTEEEIEDMFPYVANDKMFNLRQLDKREAILWTLKRLGILLDKNQKSET